MSITPDQRETAGVIAGILRPRSIAVIGASARPGSIARTIVKNLESNGFHGEIHLVGRQAGQLGNREILPGVAALPEGAADLAVLALPAEAMPEAVAGLGKRRVTAALCFASGFAEAGQEGRGLQERLSSAALEAGVRLVGPNCVGFFNYADSVHVAMVDVGAQPPMAVGQGPGIAIVGQSGTAGPFVAASLTQRGVPLSYSITTGNEADLQLADFVEFLAGDPRTGAIALYAEQVRDPQRFLAAARLVRDQGKNVVVLHPGRSEASRDAALSHTGALTGEHRLIQSVLTHAGVAVVDSLEELIDVSELLLRFPDPPAGGLGLITGSGGLCAIMQDSCDALGIPVPELSPSGAGRLAGVLPEFLPARNPLDVGTGIAENPGMLRVGLETFDAEQQIGSIAVSFPVMNPELSQTLLESFIRSARKPSIYVVMAEDRPFWPAFEERARQTGTVVMRSPERAARALAALNRATRARHATRAAGASVPVARLQPGVMPEWRSKELLAAVGVPVPVGVLASTDDEAAEIAERIGYPVAAKVQAAGLPHKTDAGAVAVGIAGEPQLRSELRRIRENVRRVAPGIEPEGILIEQMARPGVELVVGARRDPAWGPVLMVGLGGVLIETLDDVRLFPPDLSTDSIIAELRSLSAAAVFSGVRGGEPANLPAVAGIVSALGSFMLAHEEVLEVDVNPVIATAEGAIALDALIVAGPVR